MADHNSSMESGSSADEASSAVHPTSNTFETSMWEGWTHVSNGDDVSTSNILPELASSRLAVYQTDHMLSNWLSGFHPLSQHGLSLDLGHSPDPIDQSQAFMQEGLAVDSDHSLSGMYTRSNSKIDSGTLYSAVSNHHSSDRGQLPSSGKSRLDDSSHFVYEKPTAPLQQHSLGPESPSSPLAIHNGMLQPFGDPWDSHHTNSAWPASTSPLPQSHSTTLQLLGGGPVTDAIHQLNVDQFQAAKRELFPLTGIQRTPIFYRDHHARVFLPDHSPNATHHLEGFPSTLVHQVANPNHTEIFVGPNGNYVSLPAGWSSEYHRGGITVGSSVKPTKPTFLDPCKETTSMCTETNLTTTRRSGQEMNFLGREERTSTSGSAVSNIFTGCNRGASQHVMQSQAPGKRHLESVGVGTEYTINPPPKRQNVSVDQAKIFWRGNLDPTARYSPSTSCSLASGPSDPIAIGPALNTNGKPRARRGSATDPQSVYARHRRERINERLKILQQMVPNGTKVDIVTMLEESHSFIRFLEHQVELLKSDEDWKYATPNTYNGMDISHLYVQAMESSA